MKIVFAHFGNRLPKHLTLNIERCKTLFPNIPIVLITNRECKVPRTAELEVSIYDTSSEWLQLDSDLSHPKDFRDNFWLTSVARFLAIKDYLANSPGEILHLESDVILSEDFHFDRFSKLAKPIAFPILSSSQGIASTLYIRNYETAASLVSLTLEMASKDSKTTDMLVLRSFYKSYPEKTQLLHIGPLGKTAYRNFGDGTILEEMTSAALIFNGCFDGLDIGYYLFGVDPRNAKGKKYLRKPLANSFLNVKETNIKYSSPRNFLNISSNLSEPEIPVFSLHIHSKNAHLFRVKKATKLFKVAVDNYLLPESIEFVPRIFLHSIIQAVKRRLSKRK